MAVELSKGRPGLGVPAKEPEARPSLLYRWRRGLLAKTTLGDKGHGQERKLLGQRGGRKFFQGA